jgi:predicted RNA-binding Zn ribbon-like protein
MCGDGSRGGTGDAIVSVRPAGGGPSGALRCDRWRAAGRPGGAQPYELLGALSRLRVAPVAGDTYVWAWERGGEDDGGPLLERPLWPVVRSAAELLTSPKLGRVKVCSGERCGWMFLDESRNGSRKWCDSRDCGNRASVRKHLALKRASDS